MCDVDVDVDWKAAAEKLRRELDYARSEAACERERRELMEYRVEELSALATHHPPTPTPAPPALTSQDLQTAAWLNFVSAAKRSHLNERDLLLVSGATLRQLIQHCGLAANPVEVARIELHWAKHQQQLDSVAVASPQTYTPTAAPYEAELLWENERLMRLQESQAYVPGPPEAPATPMAYAPHSAKGSGRAYSPQVNVVDVEHDFTVPPPALRSQLATRRSLSHRSPSQANPNAMRSPGGRQHQQAAASPDARVLPPYDVAGAVRMRVKPLGRVGGAGGGGGVTSSPQSAARSRITQGSLGSSSMVCRMVSGCFVCNIFCVPQAFCTATLFRGL